MVVAFEVLNEPLPDRLSGIDAVVQFSRDAYGKVRTVSDTPVILSDAFKDTSFWGNILPSDEASNGCIRSLLTQLWLMDIVSFT